MNRQEKPSAATASSMDSEISSTTDRVVARTLTSAPHDNRTSSHSSNDNRPNPRRTNQSSKMMRINDPKSSQYNTVSTTNAAQNELTTVQSGSSDVNLNRSELVHVPIIGYEVMEERARFTIFKLKVVACDNQSWLVFRRYTDFVRLYTRIKTELPNINLPLPGKRLWFRDNFEPAFLEERVRGLQTFVNSVLRRLPNHPIIMEFLCLNEPPQTPGYQPEAQALFGALEDSIDAMKTQLKQKDATILYLQQRLVLLESQVAGCDSCVAKIRGDS